MPGCKFDDEIAVLNYERIGNANDPPTALTRSGVKRTFDMGRIAARGRNNGRAECWGRRLR